MNYENPGSHVRTQIRHAMAKILYGLPTTGNRVFVSRVYPLESAALPGIIIVTESDQADEEIAGWSQLQLVIRVYARATVHLDDVLDQVEMEVRKALAENKTLNGLVKDITCLHTRIQLENGGEQPIGMSEMIFKSDYRMAENDLTISVN